MKSLAQTALAYARKHELLKAGDRVGVAVSGGADSVALLRLLMELRREVGIVLSVVHFNHKLRGAESDADERFVAALARHHKLELHHDSGDVAAHAAEKGLSLEAAAREMRYVYFRRLLAGPSLDKIATAHTLDDQAETVLLRVGRGAGTRGLAGIYPRLSVPGSRFSENRGQSSATAHQGNTSIIRPLLGIRRKDIEAFLKALPQDWRDDSSNRDLRHARNRVRHGILPRLERGLNPAIREALAETAEIARAEEDYWGREVARVLPMVCLAAAGRHRDSRREAGATVALGELSALPLALQRRVIRAAAEQLGLRLEFRQVEEILALGSGAARSVGLSAKWRVSHSKTELRFESTEAESKAFLDYDYALCVPGRVRVVEIGKWVEAVQVSADAAGYNPDHLLDPALVSKELRVRNWRAGDRFWPEHTKAPKKIKELLQKHRVAGEEKRLWPIVVSGDEIVWVRGFALAPRLRLGESVPGKEGLLIREINDRGKGASGVKT